MNQDVFSRHLVVISPVPDGVIGDVRDYGLERVHDRPATRYATEDPVTGLPNRRELLHRLDELLQLPTRPDYRVALLCCDLDNFQVINDGLGPEYGDALLRSVAQRLLESMRPYAFLARSGGDEFAAVYLVESERAALLLAEQLRDSLRLPFVLDGRLISVTVSVGISMGDRSSTAEALLRDADIALHRAQHEGSDRVLAFKAEFHDLVVNRLEVEGWLRRSLSDQSLVVHYQPIVSLHSGCIVAGEALVRGLGKDGSSVPPVDFLEVARQLGLIPFIDEWVLGRSLAAAALWRLTWGQEAPAVAVNIASLGIGSKLIDEAVIDLLDLYGLPGEALWLELSEATIFAADGDVIVALKNLASRGVRIAIDDFGTGHSSLARLRELPVDILKADRGFLKAFPGLARDEALVRAVASIASSFGLRSIAEGVERVDQVAPLRRDGFDMVQGYLFSPAVSPEAFLELIPLHAHFAELAGITDVPLWSMENPLIGEVVH